MKTNKQGVRDLNDRAVNGRQHGRNSACSHVYAGPLVVVGQEYDDLYDEWFDVRAPTCVGCGRAGWRL